MLPAFPIEITSKNNDCFSGSNFLHSFRAKNKLKCHEKVCKDKDFNGVVMPTQNIYILKSNQCKISHNVPYINYADLESLIKK